MRRTECFTRCKVCPLTGRLNFDLQHEIVPNLGRVDLVSVLGDDLHQANWWRTGVSDRSSGRQHRYVEAESNILLSSLIDTFDVVCLCLVCHQFRMLLDYQNETGLSLKVPRND